MKQNTRRTYRDVTTILAAIALAGATVGGCRRVDQPRSDGPPPGSSSELPREITTSTGAEMTLIPAGQFSMGADGAVDTQPVRTISIEAFYMDRHEVTQALYERITGTNPARRKGRTNPVERVRWSDAIKFCNARSQAEGLEPCYDLATRECRFEADGYRLPTEAEWEYACRAGGGHDYSFGADVGQLDSHAWTKGNARRRHHPVGEKDANAFGLHDTSGNVWEWCNDWYRVDSYGQGPADNPRGPPDGEKKVLRGGAFSSSSASCCSWTRYCDEPGFTDACVASDDYGFRCVRRAAP